METETGVPLLVRFSGAAIAFIILLVSLALHEFGHAIAADKRGDPLPRAQGRVTLNPLAHLDPIGSFLIPGLMIFLPLVAGTMSFALIGWGKPVQISLPNPKTRRLDDILITLAGPSVNIVLALLAAIATGVLVGLLGSTGVEIFERVLLPMIVINVALAVFNLIPIPPLDGSHLLRYAVGMSDELYHWLASNGWWVLLILINIPYTMELFRSLHRFAVTPLLSLAGVIVEAIRGGG